MKLQDLTPNGIKLNEAKMTPAKVHKIQKDLVKTIDALKKNFPLYKAAKDAGDTKKLEKHRDIAVKLTNKKKDLESDLDRALGGLYQDAELELTEKFGRVGKGFRPGDRFGGQDGDEDMSKGLERLKSKFEGPLHAIMDLIKHPDDLVAAIQLLIDKSEETSKGLGKRSKSAIQKLVHDL